jgi:hypothetical protein
LYGALILLHVGHATNAVEAVLTIAGVIVTMLALAVAAVSIWPRSIPAARQDRVVRQSRSHLDEDQATASDRDSLGSRKQVSN